MMWLTRDMKSCIDAKEMLLKDFQRLSDFSSRAVVKSENEIKTLNTEIETLKAMVQYLVNHSKGVVVGFTHWNDVEEYVKKWALTLHLCM